ncbi:MAG TPA: hypothetical protein VGK73_38515 [Polyangiaceae bacterium]
MNRVWLALFVAQRLAILAVLAWGLKHSESEGASLFMSVGFAFMVVDTFRVLVDWRRRA